MRFNSKLIGYSFGLITAILFFVNTVTGTTRGRFTSAKDRTVPATARIDSSHAESLVTAAAYTWNVADRELPLLGLIENRLKPGLDHLLAYPADQFDFAIFKSLEFDDEQGKFLLPAISRETRGLVFIQFVRKDATNIYGSPTGAELVDKGNLKTIQTVDGTRFLFVQYPDGEFRCASIRRGAGSILNLVYTAAGLSLHGVVDSSGRSLTFNYGKEGIQSLTQTWMKNLEGLTRTWSIDDQNRDDSPRFAHAGGLETGKFLPANAVIQEYTAEMIASDRLLGQVFGGSNAVAGGNGFEPAGLAASYPFYRGDIIGDDGKIRAGHLSHSIHLYGSQDGKGDSFLYVPAGFTLRSSEPTPTDAAMTFFYPRLGNLTDVTVAVFHVADFQIVVEADRVRIGSIGGAGGSSVLYKHSHIEFYRGNTGLPPVAERAALRIAPALVFGK